MDAVGQTREREGLEPHPARAGQRSEEQPFPAKQRRLDPADPDDVVVDGGLEGDEPQLFVTVSDDLVGNGLSAGDLVRAAMPAIDGRGGGRPEMAQGKGSRGDGLPAAMEAIRRAATGAG